MSTAGTATSFYWPIEQDELVVLRIPVIDAAGDPFDVTGWTVDAKIKTGPGGTVLYTWPTGDISVSGSDVELTVPAAVSLAWEFRYGWFRVKVVHPSDATQKHRILQGRVRISLD